MASGTSTLETLFQGGMDGGEGGGSQHSKENPSSKREKQKKQICAANTTQIIFLDWSLAMQGSTYNIESSQGVSTVCDLWLVIYDLLICVCAQWRGLRT